MYLRLGTTKKFQKIKTANLFLYFNNTDGRKSEQKNEARRSKKYEELIHRLKTALLKKKRLLLLVVRKRLKRTHCQMCLLVLRF